MIVLESCCDADTFTDTVTPYISMCKDMTLCSATKHLTIEGNVKARFTRDIKRKLEVKKAVCSLSMAGKTLAAWRSVTFGQQSLVH